MMFSTQIFKDKQFLVGVTGGIAAYKSTELIRYLITQDAEVHVVMSKAAEQFITRLTLETLSRNPVGIETFPESGYSGTHHIHLADWADAAIVAPASYNFIGKLAGGIADDLITTIFAAVDCPTVIAPAMNVHMWENPILQKNIELLVKAGYLLTPPEEGFLAEGYEGKGRLANLNFLIQDVYRAIHPEPESLRGKKVLITAGRTEESVDPVRYISNRSSGKMGYSLAWEAYARGADVTLISGPTQLPPPNKIATIPVQTAAQMFKEVHSRLQKFDIFLAAAAVSDYSPKQVSKTKIKKQQSDLNLPLQLNIDIIQEVTAAKKKGQVIVGFAVETDHMEENALKKLKEKNLDAIVLNNPLEPGAGFYQDTNIVTIISKTGKKQKLPVLPKLDVAYQIFETIL